jgi:hypothetical protein
MSSVSIIKADVRNISAVTMETKVQTINLVGKKLALEWAYGQKCRLSQG